jgi:hypothetical protein
MEGVTGSNPVSPIISKPTPRAGFILSLGAKKSYFLGVSPGSPLRRFNVFGRFWSQFDYQEVLTYA